jgi:hypothetical protein
LEGVGALLVDVAGDVSSPQRYMVEPMSCCADSADAAESDVEVSSQNLTNVDWAVERLSVEE